MGSDNRRKLYNIVPTIFTIMVVFIVIFAPVPSGAAPPDTWLDRIFAFQTLIAGLLAILAAYFTVHQMQISDRKSDERHNAAMQMQVKPGILKLERALTPQLGNLKECHNGLVVLSNIMNAYHPVYASIPIDVLAKRGRHWAGRIIEIIDRPQYREGEATFPGELLELSQELRNRAKAVWEAALPIIEGIPQDSFNYNRFGQTRDDQFEQELELLFLHNSYVITKLMELETSPKKHLKYAFSCFPKYQNFPAGTL